MHSISPGAQVLEDSAVKSTRLRNTDEKENRTGETTSRTGQERRQRTNCSQMGYPGCRRHVGTSGTAREMSPARNMECCGNVPRTCRPRRSATHRCMCLAQVCRTFGCKRALDEGSCGNDQANGVSPPSANAVVSTAACRGAATASRRPASTDLCSDPSCSTIKSDQKNFMWRELSNG